MHVEKIVKYSKYYNNQCIENNRNPIKSFPEIRIK